MNIIHILIIFTIKKDVILGTTDYKITYLAKYRGGRSKPECDSISIDISYAAQYFLSILLLDIRQNRDIIILQPSPLWPYLKETSCIAKMPRKTKERN